MSCSKPFFLFFLFAAAGLSSQCWEDICCVQYCCDDPCRPCDATPDIQHAYDCGKKGVWLPEDPPLFRPFIADPRQLTYGVGWRFNDRALSQNIIPISFWDTFALYRWANVCIGPFRGQMQLSVDGGLWAVFDPCTYSSPLINADYYVGGHLTYASGCWSFRLRYFHISSHLGDEFLINNPGFDRRNPSTETLDFFASYMLTPEIRVYGGAGLTINMDTSFKTERSCVEAGAEYRIQRLGFYSDCNQLYGLPFYAMHFRYKPDFENHVDATYALGYEMGKCAGLRRRVRAFVQYHDGYSVDGQFARKATHYFSVRLTYGY